MLLVVRRRVEVCLVWCNRKKVGTVVVGTVFELLRLARRLLCRGRGGDGGCARFGGSVYARSEGPCWPLLNAAARDVTVTADYCWR